jgi:protease-4
MNPHNDSGDAPASSATTLASSVPTPSPSSDSPLSRGSVDHVLELFAREYLQDRRSDRRWRFMLRLSWILLVLVVLSMLLGERNATADTHGPHTALVELRGEISSESQASAETMLAGLKNAFEDTNAQAVVIRINSPGGSPVQSGIINDEIWRLKAKHKKKVYVVVEESCASGAYYVAAAADAIYVDKASLVGSIGVLMDGFGFTGVMSKVGVERRLITAGANKGMLDPFSPLQDKQRAFAQAMLDQIHRQFIDVVRKGRGSRLKETPELFSGLFWNGEEAIKLGLADGLGNLDYVAREIIKAEEVIDYTPKPNVAERLAKRFGAAMGEGSVHALRSLPLMH